MNQAHQESPSDVLVLTNAAANRGQAAAVGHKVELSLKHAGFVVQHELPPDPAATEEIVRCAAEQERHIVAVGGDGFIHHIVQQCAETNTTLGIVPAGTGNDFAFGLNLSTDLEVAVAAAVAPPQACDLLKLEDDSGRIRYGTTIATAGFSVSVNVKAEALRWPRGPSRYTIATLMKLVRLRRYNLELEVDGRSVDGKCLMVAIANTRSFGGGMQIAPKAEAFSGKAEVVVIRDSSALTLLRMLPKTFSGSHVDHPSVEIATGKTFRVHLTEAGKSEPCRMRSDGEDVGSLPQTVTVVRGGLQIAGVSRTQSATCEARDTDE
ncbi:MAG: diacylglycerol kinase family protein [Acidimicrobiales bacterium]|nr:diacylglycerol kinase family protein [Acidimicrobiales bacterium]